MFIYSLKTFDFVIKLFNTLFLLCTCDDNRFIVNRICVNWSWHTYEMHSVCLHKPGVTGGTLPGARWGSTTTSRTSRSTSADESSPTTSDSGSCLKSIGGSCLKSIGGDSLVLPHHFPTAGKLFPHRNFIPTTAAMSQVLHCKPQVLSRVFSAKSRDLIWILHSQDLSSLLVSSPFRRLSRIFYRVEKTPNLAMRMVILLVLLSNTRVLLSSY